MEKLALERLARKMYSIASPNKHQFFRKSYYADGSGKVIPWAQLGFEKDQWLEMAKLAMDASEKLIKDQNARKK